MGRVGLGSVSELTHEPGLQGPAQHDFIISKPALLCPAQPSQPSPAQPSPASPAPVSGDRSVSHEDKTQDSGYFTNFAELLDPELQRREETCRESFFSRHLECQASLLLCPRPSAHMAQMSSHTKGNFLSTKWDLLQGCFQIRRGVK